VIAVMAAVVVAVMTAVIIAIVFCFGVRGLGVGMASKCISHSLSLIGTRIVFVSSICRRNSSISH
jgi:hypothetical protein